VNRIQKSADRGRDPTPTPWGIAAAEVINAADIRQTDVAKKIGAQKAFLNRFLTGMRRPTLQAMQSINNVIAELSGCPRVKDYLDFEALVSLPGADDIAETALLAGATRCLRWYESFFRPGAIETVGDRIRALGKREKRDVVVALNRALRRTAISDLTAPSSPVGFSAVRDALSSSGVAVDDLISERCDEQLAWERFAQTVQQELAAQETRGPAYERFAATQRILAAASNLALAAVKVRMTNTDGVVLEAVSFENGRKVSRFDGDPQAIWAPFQPPRVAITFIKDKP